MIEGRIESKQREVYEELWEIMRSCLVLGLIGGG
jgi:hypothetical protein